MHIAVISDTHGHVPNTMKAIRMLESLEVDEVIHCGDIGGAGIVSLFADWPTHFVLGNIDRNSQALEMAIERAGLHFHGRFGSLERESLHIAFLHSDDEGRFQSAITGGEWDLVCHGHTHAAQKYYSGKTLVLNPGALTQATPLSFAIVKLPSLEVVSITID